MPGVTIGGGSLADARADRLSFGLYAPSGAGKTLGAASFGGGDYGKIIHFNIEGGPEEGAGGATTLKYAQGIHDRIRPADVLLLNVRTWQDMQAQMAWLRRNVERLVEEGYRVMVWDGGTALSYCIEQAITRIDPAKLKGYSRENVMSHKRELITNLLENPTLALEQSDYGMIYDRYIEAHSIAKQYPFTFITTFLEKETYDEQTRRYRTGIGPKLVGKMLPAQMPAEFDGFFHCERTEKGEWVWLTANDPTQPGNTNQYHAKHRFGLKLAQYEPADGVNLLKKLGAIASVG